MAKKCEVFVGATFGRLTIAEVYREAYTDDGLHRTRLMVACQCSCGGTWIDPAYGLGKNTNSCGCLREETRTTHGCSRRDDHRLYGVWKGMRARCLDETHHSYHRYGGRGIKICDEWINDVNAFCRWAESSGYKPGLTLDRRESNGNYEPSNCRWLTRKEQNRNRRDNVRFEAWGEAKLLTEWVEDPRVVIKCSKTLMYRIRRLKWDIERALTTPSRGWTRRNHARV